jgi:hypothetical protein
MSKAWLGCDADHSSPPSTEVKNEYELHLLPPCHLHGGSRTALLLLYGYTQDPISPNPNTRSARTSINNLNHKKLDSFLRQ